MLGGCARAPAGEPGSASGTTPSFFTLFPEDCEQPVWPVNIVEDCITTDESGVVFGTSPVMATCDQSTHTGGTRPASSYGSDQSVSGPGSARPPAEGPGVVSGTHPVQATYDQSTPTGGTCPASTDGSDLLVPGPGPPVQTTFGQFTHTDDICPVSSAGAQGFPQPSDPGPVQAIFHQSPPSGVNCPAAAHGTYGPQTTSTVQPFALCTPTDGPGVVSGTPPIQATYDQSTPTGGTCPAPTDRSDQLVPGPGSARPPADGPGVVSGTPPV